MWSAVQARLCSDALQALRREEEWAANQVFFQEYREKEEKRKQENFLKVRPDFVVCCASAASLMLCRKHAGRSWSRSARRSARS